MDVPLLSPRKKGPARIPEYITTVSATLCVFCGGAAISWISPALPMLLSGNATLILTPEEGSWVSSLLPVGALIGAPVSGSIADAIGRKMTLLSQGVLLMISWLMILVAESKYVLYVARICAGVAVGVSTSVSPMYISEIADEGIKGGLCSYTQLMLVSGVLYGYAVGAFFSYRMMAILCELVAVLFLLCFVGAPESLVYSLWRGRRLEAERNLGRLRGAGWDTGEEMVTLELRVGVLRSARPPFASRYVFKAAAICALLMACQQLSGINVIIFYSTGIFTEVGGELMEPKYSTLAVGVTQVVATYFSTLLLSRLGRRCLFVASASLMGLCLIVLGAYFNLRADVAGLSWLPILVVNLYVVAFSVGLGPVPFVVLGEMLPAEIKGSVSGLSVAVNWAMAFFVVKSFDSLNSAVGLDYTYWFFGTLCVLISVLMRVCMIETRGKSMEAIREELAGGSLTGYVGI